MNGKRILPETTNEMSDGFVRCDFIVSEINRLIFLGVNLGINCALPSCHSIVRVVNSFLKDFEIVDGFIPVIKSKIQDSKVVDFGVVPMHHSWLAFKSNPKFIIDVIPIGSVPPFISSNFLYLDEYSPEYVPSGLPKGVDLEDVHQEAEKMFHVIKDSLIKRNSKSESAP